MSETGKKELKKVVEVSQFFRAVPVDHYELTVRDDGTAKIMFYTEHLISRIGFMRTEPDKVIRELQVEVNMSLPQLIRLGETIKGMAKKSYQEFFKTWEESKKHLLKEE